MANTKSNRKSYRFSDETQKQLDELLLADLNYCNQFGSAKKNETQIVEEAIDHLYTAKTSGKYQSQLFQSMQDFITMVINENLKNFVTSLNQNLEVTMLNYELTKLCLYGENISNHPDVMEKVLKENQLFEDLAHKSLIEKTTGNDEGNTNESK